MCSWATVRSTIRCSSTQNSNTDDSHDYAFINNDHVHFWRKYSEQFDIITSSCIWNSFGSIRFLSIRDQCLRGANAVSNRNRPLLQFSNHVPFVVHICRDSILNDMCNWPYSGDDDAYSAQNTNKWDVILRSYGEYLSERQNTCSGTAGLFSIQRLDRACMLASHRSKEARRSIWIHNTGIFNSAIISR